MKTREILLAAATPAAAVVAAAGVAAALLWLGGHSPTDAFAALLRGAFGSWDRFVSASLVRATPLLLTGLAVALAFRAHVWNIGAEGQLHVGAAAGVAVALLLPPTHALVALPVTLLVAGLAGAAWAAAPAAMRAGLGVGEVITTLLMNFVALFLVQFLVQGPLRESRGVLNQTDEIPAFARLPALIPGTRLHLGFLVAVAIAVALWLHLTRSPGGFKIRTVGASPRAAEVSGRFKPEPVVRTVFLTSGAIAGLAGWIEVSGITHRMYEGLSPGWGYTAIAVALLARLNPLGVAVTAVAFGALGAGGGAMQRDAGVGEAWVRGIEALVILSTLAIDRALQLARTRGRL